MATYKVKNWKKFQHFTNRRPPWIKLYRDLLDDHEFHKLSGETAKHLFMLWLLASEDDSKTGTLPDVSAIAFRLRISENRVTTSISELKNWVYQDDINMISTGYQDDIPETETETETEKIVLPDKTAPNDDEFWKEITLLYAWVDVAKESAKMQAWLLTPKGRGRKLTKRFVCNWLNKCDKPLQVDSSQQPSAPRKLTMFELTKQRELVVKALPRAYGEECAKLREQLKSIDQQMMEVGK